MMFNTFPYSPNVSAFLLTYFLLEGGAIANNMDPDQTAPKVQSVCFLDKNLVWSALD